MAGSLTGTYCALVSLFGCTVKNGGKQKVVLLGPLETGKQGLLPYVILINAHHNTTVVSFPDDYFAAPD